jgi:hypothetical protein
MHGHPIIEEADEWQPVTKTARKRLPTSKSKEKRQEQFIAACRRSGFDGFEIVQILADWYGWQKVTITPAPGIIEHTVNNAWSQSQKDKERGSHHG